MIFNEKYSFFLIWILECASTLSIRDGINREEKDGYILLHKNCVKYVCVCVYRERERERQRGKDQMGEVITTNLTSGHKQGTEDKNS